MLEHALVGVGAGAGAMLRFSIAQRAAAGAATANAGKIHAMWAIAGVNVIGSFGLGCLAGSKTSRKRSLLLGTGACGGFTTYSTFAVDAAQLLREQRYGISALFVTSSCIGSIVAAGAGWAVASRFSH
eukprot:m.471237 g.471237  ORF g.471237 m.471237 type:complete len:128 (+) comp30758_c0_seq1:201-584(+)